MLLGGPASDVGGERTFAYCSQSITDVVSFETTMEQRGQKKLEKEADV